MKELRILGKADWSREILNIVSELSHINSNENIMVFLRHSERYDYPGFEDKIKASLTPEGIKAAKELGLILPKSRKYRIYHSKIERCANTANLIYQSLNNDLKTGNKAGNACINGYLPTLTEFHVDKNEFKKYIQRDASNFVRNWLAGYYNPKYFESALHYAKRAAKELFNIHQSAQKGSTDLFISHDVNIITLRAVWTGIFPGPSDPWIEFLGGFILKLKPEYMEIYYEGKWEKVFYPYWWAHVVNESK